MREARRRYRLAAAALHPPPAQDRTAKERQRKEGQAMNVWQGLSLYVWQVKNCGPYRANSPDMWEHMVNTIKAVGLSTVYLKVADGIWNYNLTPRGANWDDDILPGLCAALKAAGIPVIGWQYVYGELPEREAARAIERINQLQLDAWVIDAETEYKKAGPGAAKKYMKKIKAACPTLPLALSSYRFPSYHPDFPWAAFLQYLDPARDVHMPQVYWEGDSRWNAGEIQLEQSVEELLHLKPLPIVPIGPMYDRGDWKPTLKQFIEFEEIAWNMRPTVPGLGFWSWDSELRKHDGEGPGNDNGLGWWDFLKLNAPNWKGTPPPVTPPPELTDKEKLDILWQMHQQK